MVRLSYQLDTVRPWCLSTKTLSTETTYHIASWRVLWPVLPKKRVLFGTRDVDCDSTLGLLIDSEIVLSTRYGKTMVFINKNLINRDRLSTRPYQPRPLINKVDSW